MRIFDRKFMQYQLAFSIWYNLNARYLFISMVFIAVAFFSNNYFYLISIPILYGYGYFRFQALLNAKDKNLIRRMERQYRYYQRKNEKSQGKHAYQLEKILFAVELEKIGIEEAIGNIKELLKIRPKMEKAAKGVLLSLYIIGKQEGSISEIPDNLIQHLDLVIEKEDNPNAIFDFVRMALKLEDYELALKLLDKAEEKSQDYKKHRHPIVKSIYQTSLVAIPYYRSIAKGKLKDGNGAQEQLDIAIKNAKSKKLKNLMLEESRNWV